MNIAAKSFCKEERLGSRKIIESLFIDGNIFYSGALKVIWKTSESDLQTTKAAFSAPKKIFKLAVTRNLIKRRMREAYRNNKHILYNHLSEKNISVSLFFILKDKDAPSYNVIEKSIKEAINKLISLI